MKKDYPFYKNDPVDSIVQIIKRSAKHYADSVALRFKQNKQVKQKTYIELADDCCINAQKFLGLNLRTGHIAIIGTSSYEWLAAYFGAVFAGMVAVPLDKELSPETVYDMMTIADVDCLVYDQKRADVKEYVEGKGGGLCISFDELMQMSYDIKLNLPCTKPDKVSAILFTSGTTGKSKGVMLTQRNIASNVVQGLGAVDLRHGMDTIMSVLPFNHAYEMTCTILGMIYKGVPICISSGLKYVQKEFIEYKPTVIFVVPLFVETLYKRIEATVKNQGNELKFKFAVMFSNLMRMLGIDITDMLFGKIKKAFGGSLKIIMCGGAPLKEELIKKYRNIGINLFQGYGLTECSPLLTVNFDYYHRPNSVGKVVCGNNIKIVDGEIWAKGASVSSGYYNDQDETKSNFEGGWFKTGDLGYVDKDNFVFISGRKKNLIILSNGENVSAEEIEKMIYTIPNVTEVIVRGQDNRIVAEIYSESGNSNLIKIQISELNKKLQSYKQIDDVVFRETPFARTTTKKIIRSK